jgi:hypothetical protein
MKQPHPGLEMGVTLVDSLLARIRLEHASITAAQADPVASCAHFADGGVGICLPHYASNVPGLGVTP